MLEIVYEPRLYVNMSTHYLLYHGDFKHERKRDRKVSLSRTNYSVYTKLK